MVNGKFNVMNDWLARVQEKCPKKARSKKQVKDREGLPRLEELDALLQQGRDMNLVFVEEEERLTQVMAGCAITVLTMLDNSSYASLGIDMHINIYHYVRALK